jgi:hypothetical protein
MRWPAGLSGTTSICGAAALGRALGFGTSSMSGTSANRARHWRAHRWARVRLSPFFWHEKDQECYRWTVDVYSAEASTPFQALFASRLVALVLLGAPFLVLLCVARSLHRARVSIGNDTCTVQRPNPASRTRWRFSRRFFTFAAFTAYGEARCAMD